MTLSLRLAMQRPCRRTFLLNNRKRRVRLMAGQQSKIDYEDEFEYEDDKNKAGHTFYTS